MANEYLSCDRSIKIPSAIWQFVPCTTSAVWMVFCATDALLESANHGWHDTKYLRHTKSREFCNFNFCVNLVPFTKDKFV